MKKLKITVTKKIYEKTAMCGDGEFKLPNSLSRYSSQNCAISAACQELFPQCDVSDYTITNSSREDKGIDTSRWHIELPKVATEFIRKFDALTPEERVKMQPFSFEVELNDDVLACIDISDFKKTDTLELV